MLAIASFILLKLIILSSIAFFLYQFLKERRQRRKDMVMFQYELKNMVKELRELRKNKKENNE